jgi:hypothetical protein
MSFIFCTHQQILLSNQIKENEVGGRSEKGEEKKVCKVLVGMTEVKRPLGRPSHRWENGI